MVVAQTKAIDRLELHLKGYVEQKQLTEFYLTQTQENDYERRQKPRRV